MPPMLRVKSTVAMEFWKEQQQFVEYSSFLNANQQASFWIHLKRELTFKTVLYYQSGKCRCWMESILNDINTTTAILSWNHSTTKNTYLKPQQSVDIFGLVCLEAGQYKKVLSALSNTLNHMREVPLLLQICSKDRNQPETEELARLIMKSCHQLFIPNVLLLMFDFFVTGSLYAYRNFPTFRLETQTYHTALTLFPYKLGNLQGAAIKSLPDLAEPFTIATRDRNGSLKITGMLWRLMSEFARYLNASLELSLNPNTSESTKLNFFAIQQILDKGTVDIGACIYPLSFSSKSSMYLFSYPIFVGSWCTMLPMERVVSAEEALTGVLESPWTWLYLGIIYSLIQWLHQRSTLRVPFMGLIPSLIQLTLLCTVLAQLSAMFVHPQQLKLINSFDQLKSEHLRIIGLRSEFIRYPDDIRIKYASSFISYENYTKFLAHRKSFNTSYGYSVSSVKWQMYAEKQKYFKRPIFRYSSDLCFSHLVHNALMLQENSLYRHQLNFFVLRLQQHGLLEFWFVHSFYDMLRAGRYHLNDFSTKVEVQPVSWMDLSYIVMLYGYSLVVCFLVFLTELAMHLFQLYLNML